jgi:hypothetical protein
VVRLAGTQQVWGIAADGTRFANVELMRSTKARFSLR